MKQHFVMFAAYNAWANQRIYEAASGLTKEEFARDAGAFFKSMRGTLNHLAGHRQDLDEALYGRGRCARRRSTPSSTSISRNCASRASSRTSAWSTGSAR